MNSPDEHVPATELRAGMWFRSLGSGFISRHIDSVGYGCPCKYGSRSLGRDGQHECTDRVIVFAERGKFRQHYHPQAVVTIEARA